ncbi:MAG: hypothetical protein PVI30_20035 [Myxococcales bacterium]|jgi:hypothetical protein
MGGLRCGLVCLLLGAFPSVVAADDDFPVVDDPLLVPSDWERTSANGRWSDPETEEIAILEDTLLEPWEPVRATPTPPPSDRCSCGGLLVPRGW